MMRIDLVVLAAAGCVAACARGAADAVPPGPQSAAAAELTDASPKARTLRTAKVGAGLDMSLAPHGLIVPGEPGALTLDIRERHAAGVLTLTARGSEGLRLEPSAPSARFPLDGADAHQWDLFVSAAADGTYYLDVIAVIEEGGATVAGEAKSFAVRIGTGGDGPRKGAPAPVEDAAGERVIVLPAEETIRP